MCRNCTRARECDACSCFALRLCPTFVSLDALYKHIRSCVFARRLCSSPLYSRSFATAADVDFHRGSLLLMCVRVQAVLTRVVFYIISIYQHIETAYIQELPVYLQKHQFFYPCSRVCWFNNCIHIVGTSIHTAGARNRIGPIE